MFQRWKVVLLSMSIGLILFGANAYPVSIAQNNDFPIGLYMKYNITVYPDNPLEPGYDYDIVYNITSWVDKVNYIVEFVCNNDGDAHTYVRALFDINMGLPGYPPIWRNVTTWEINDMYSISGINYEVHNKVRYGTTGEWFILWNVTENANMTIKTLLGYHSSLGVLIDYWRETNSTNGGPTYECLDLLLTNTNLDNYYSLTNDSTPTTSTTSTTSTSQPTTTPITTSDINGPSFALPSMEVFLSVGIVIESIIIVLLFSRRQQRTLWS